MNVQPLGLLPPEVAAIEAVFAALAGSAAGGSPTAPTDAFAILLDAASAAGSPASGPPSGQGAATPGSASPVVAEAERFLGVPYRWGGDSPATGFDCSGLVQYVFAQLGVALPRTSEQQATVGQAVPNLAAAQPGDLLFFEPGANGAPPGEPGHVAIYAGDGEMIAAPRTGEVVQLQPVPSEPVAIRRVPLGPAAPGAPVQMGQVLVPAADAPLVTQAAASAKVPAALLAAILYEESRFDPSARSSAGAEGIAQFMPATAAAQGIDPFDPAQAIPAAARLLAGYRAAFGSWSLAVAAYAAGGGAVEQAGGIPNDGSTPAYVSTVLSLANLAAGS
ncbi:MAG TPA: NlpC/P60 family protein [Acidimicrobiales bacterium]|nr:NlpC/P60 family protein [Acidimicrobiales bacterium]